MASKPPRFTVCALLYGNYHELASRCLASLSDNIQPGDVEVRLGLNEVGEGTKGVVDWFVKLHPETLVYESQENIFKYPMMRRMFYDPDRPIRSPFVVWFDDDSYIKTQQPAQPKGEWFDELAHAMTDSDMLGAIYVMPLKGNQHLWVQDQPWYAGKHVYSAMTARFATGGFWCIRSDVLTRYDWPPEELRHRGGDVMLGELCRQQDLRLRQFNKGVAVNADEQGRESKARRRGYDERPIGADYVPGPIQQAADVLPPAPPPPAPPSSSVKPQPPKLFNPGL